MQGTILSSKTKKYTLVSYILTQSRFVLFPEHSHQIRRVRTPDICILQKGRATAYGKDVHVPIVNIRKRVVLCLETMHRVKALISFHLCSVVHPTSFPFSPPTPPPPPPPPPPLPPAYMYTHTHTHSSMVIIVNPWPQSSIFWSARKRGDTGKLQGRDTYRGSVPN